MTRCVHPKWHEVDGYSACVVCDFTPGIDFETSDAPDVEEYMPIEEYRALVVASSQGDGHG